MSDNGSKLGSPSKRAMSPSKKGDDPFGRSGLGGFGSSAQLQTQAEVDWFNFETRMRKLIQEMLEPTIQRGLEDREDLNRLNTIVDDHRKKLEELEYANQKVDRKADRFNDAIAKIQELVRNRPAFSYLVRVCSCLCSETSAKSQRRSCRTRSSTSRRWLIRSALSAWTL